MGKTMESCVSSIVYLQQGWLSTSHQTVSGWRSWSGKEEALYVVTEHMEVQQLSYPNITILHLEFNFVSILTEQ